MVSLPTGTFELERRYQQDGRTLKAQLRLIESEVNELVERSLGLQLHRKVLVAGSNCMLDFIRCATGLESTDGMSGYKDHPAIHIDELVLLYDSIAGKRYDLLGEYYPTNPQFMFGADKALVNMIAIARCLCADIVIPTNESLSSGLARLAMSRPSALEQLGVEVNRWA